MIDFDTLQEHADAIIELAHYINDRTDMPIFDAMKIASDIYNSHERNNWLSNIDDRLMELDATIQKR